MRGYGTVQSMAYTEMLVDEIAQEIGLDAIELRQRNVLKSSMKNTQGASPSGHLRIGEILEMAAKDPMGPSAPSARPTSRRPTPACSTA